MWKGWAPQVTGAARLCIHVRAHACGAVCGRLLGQVGVEVSLGSVGNLFQSSLQLTRRPNEPGQGLLLWASPAKPSRTVTAITQTLQPTYCSPAHTKFHPRPDRTLPTSQLWIETPVGFSLFSCLKNIC